MEFTKDAYTMLQGDLTIPLEASDFQFLGWSKTIIMPN
jgi:hypothetical protein